MTVVILGKETEWRKKQRRGILTVPGEIAARDAWWGKSMQSVDLDPRVHPALRQAVLSIAGQFIAKHEAEGERYIAEDEVHVYGPFWTETALRAMVDNESMSVTAEQQSALITERDHDPHAFAHYLLVANFAVKMVPSEEGADERSAIS